MKNRILFLRSIAWRIAMTVSAALCLRCDRHRANQRSMGRAISSRAARRFASSFVRMQYLWEAESQPTCVNAARDPA